jgi:hypothetical protein
MQKAIVSLVLALGMDLVLAGEGIAGGGAGTGLDGQMLAEQKSFLECLAYVYNPGLWISYDNRPYFMPQTEAQRKQIEAMKAARDRYVAFTNLETRHEFVAKVLAEGGLDADRQQMLLVPYAPTNLSLTPVLGRPAQVVERYSVVKSLPRGEALIRAGDSICRVMGFGRGASDAYRTNALLVFEGRTNYRTDDNQVEWVVDSFTDVGLTAEEVAVLDGAVAAFRRKAAALGETLAASQRKADANRQTVAESQRKAPTLGPAPGKSDARQEFENLQARATENSPFIEYLLAKAYLEGKGTAKDEKLGLLWMNKAARDGSGDADTYLGGLKGK